MARPVDRDSLGDSDSEVKVGWATGSSGLVVEPWLRWLCIRLTLGCNNGGWSTVSESEGVSTGGGDRSLHRVCSNSGCAAVVARDSVVMVLGVGAARGGLAVPRLTFNNIVILS